MNVALGLSVHCADTLASILGKTTSLLPNALFATLGMPREESLTDVKHVSPLLIEPREAADQAARVRPAGHRPRTQTGL